MSVSVYVVAQRKVTDEDMQRISIVHNLTNLDHKIPTTLVDELTERFGKDALEGFLYRDNPLPKGKNIVEVPVSGDGDPEYSGGMVIDLKNLPPDTVSLRIFTQ